MFINTVVVGCGGFIGSIIRYILNQLIYDHLNYPIYPYGTLLINVIGCFLIGVVSGLSETRAALTPEIRIFIQIGLLGGFTTFSTFGYETFNLLRDGQFLLGFGNVLLQVVIGLLAVAFGYIISH